MPKHEITVHGYTQTASATFIAARGKVLMDARRPTPPGYPDTEPGSVSVPVALEAEQFLQAVDTITTAIVEDETVPLVERVKAWRPTFGEVMELLSRAQAADWDLTDADARLDWLLFVGMGINPEEYRAAQRRTEG